MSEPTVEDIATMRAEGSLREYFQLLTGRPAPVAPKPAQAPAEEPGYHIARPGAWPCGTAASGPTPPACTHQPNPPGTPQPERTTT